MAISKALIASVLISLIVIHLVEADQVVNTDAAKKKIDCGAACSARCQLSSRPNLCKRACGTCCSRCSCVPPGTSGNRDVCPCYATMTTRGGKLKCP
ncbi:snakin-2-like isoform X1 [Quercus lobata]|uniref:snakin-2-like isoform X1 n=1 Tax=Quercus lobata TaxID=97700 RepID=UPI001248A2BE|nr:snakin-2-like isoform X1 [Quercus lobata]